MVLPIDNYIVRRFKTNKTQILHRIRLKKFVPNTPLENKYSKEKLQPDDETVIPQDNLYTISWEADFDYQDFELKQDDNRNEVSQTPDSDAIGTTSDYVIYDKANDETRPRTATSRETHPYCMTKKTSVTILKKNKQSSEIKRPNTATSQANQNSSDTPTELHNETNDCTKYIPRRGEDNPVPGKSNDATNEKMEENSSPRGGKYILRTNPNPNFTDEHRYLSEL